MLVLVNPRSQGVVMHFSVAKLSSEVLHWPNECSGFKEGPCVGQTENPKAVIQSTHSNSHENVPASWVHFSLSATSAEHPLSHVGFSWRLALLCLLKKEEDGVNAFYQM